MNEVGKITAYLTRVQDDEIKKSGAVVPVLYEKPLIRHPDIIKIGDEYFTCTSTAPLSYHKAVFAEANEVIDGKVI